MHGGGNWTSFCPICGIHFRISFNKKELKEHISKHKPSKHVKLWENNKDNMIKNIDKFNEIIKKETFINYNKITLLLPNSMIKHKVKYDDDNTFEKYGEVYFNKLIYDEDAIKGLPMHTECWELAKKKYNHKLVFEDFINNKNLSSLTKNNFLFKSLNYGVAKYYIEQDWDNNYWQPWNKERKPSFLLNQNDWHIIYLPSGKSNEAKKNEERISKIIDKIIKGIKKDKIKENIIKRKTPVGAKKDRPSPSESATLFKEGTKKKGNDGNMYIINLDKNGVKRWKKYN